MSISRSPEAVQINGTKCTEIPDANVDIQAQQDVVDNVKVEAPNATSGVAASHPDTGSAVQAVVAGNASHSHAAVTRAWISQARMNTMPDPPAQGTDASSKSKSTRSASNNPKQPKASWFASCFGSPSKPANHPQKPLTAQQQKQVAAVQESLRRSQQKHSYNNYCKERGMTSANRDVTASANSGFAWLLCMSGFPGENGQASDGSSCFGGGQGFSMGGLDAGCGGC